MYLLSSGMFPAGIVKFIFDRSFRLKINGFLYRNLRIILQKTFTYIARRN